MSLAVDRKRTMSASLTPEPVFPPRTPSPISIFSQSTSCPLDVSSVSESASEIEIPEVLHSIETYEFMGFNHDTAVQLWERFTTCPEDEDPDILDFAMWQVKSTRDAIAEPDDWRGCMEHAGISEELQDAILQSDFADVRSTASCHFWLEDSITAAWETLESLENKLSRTRNRIQHSQDLERAPSPQTLSLSPPGLSSSPPINVGCESGMRSLADVVGFPPAPNTTISSETPSHVSGHTTLWRGGTRTSHEGFYDQETGRITLRRIASGPGDFSSSRVVYWTPQIETANKYAQYARHRTPMSDIIIVGVLVPNTWIESLTKVYLWNIANHSEDLWRKVVWASRGSITLDRDTWDTVFVDVMVGHIAKGTNIKYTRMSGPSDIKETDSLTVPVNGRQTKCIQWVFHKESAIRDFERLCRGKVFYRRMLD